MAINQKSKNKTVFLPEKEYKCTNSTACFNMGTFWLNSAILSNISWNLRLNDYILYNSIAAEHLHTYSCTLTTIAIFNSLFT